MAKEVKQGKAERTNMFSKEIFGMGLILFSVLSFLCLIIGDIIYPVGGIVRGFFIGVFGIYSFIFLLLCVYLGLKLILVKPIMSNRMRMNCFMAHLAVISVIAIIHIASAIAANATLAENLSRSYAEGKLNLSNATPAGGLGSLLLYPILKYSTPIGGYILFSLILLVTAVYFAKMILGDRLSLNGFKRVRNRTRLNESPKASQAFESGRAKEIDYNNSLDGDIGFQNNIVAEVNASKIPPRNLFLYGESNFETKSKRDLRSENNDEFKIAFANGQINQPITSRGRSYTETYTDGFEKKLEYVFTPQKPDLNKLWQPHVHAPGTEVRTEGSNQNNNNNDSRSRHSYRLPDSPSHIHDADDIYRGLDFNQTLGNASNVGANAISSLFDRQERFPPDRASDRSSNSRLNEGRASDITYQRGQPDNVKSGDKYLPKPNNIRMNIFDHSRLDGGRGENNTDSESNSGIVSGKVYRPIKTDSKIESFKRSFNPVRAANDEAEDVAITETNVTKDALGVRDSCFLSIKQTPSIAANSTKSTAKSLQIVKNEEIGPVNPIDLMPLNYRYKAPPLALLRDYGRDEEAVRANIQRQTARADVIVRTLGFRNIKAVVENIIYGPTVTRFVIRIPQNISPKSVVQAQTDLQLWLEASSDIRLIVPIPGTSTIGIEVPNEKPTTVGLKEIIASKQFKNIKQNSVTFALGKDIVGEPVLLDVMDMPHLIIAGATGTGKSVCLNALLVSLMYKFSPEDLRIVIVDPKQVEFEMYKGIPHLLFNEILDNPSSALAMLEWATVEMDRRYTQFKEKRVRKLSEYNNSIDPMTERRLPYLIILIDEFADMMAAGDRKKIENYVGRLAQKARAAGISLIFATQRPSADIMDGSIKTNFTSRICFKTSSGTDSIVVVGETGAEKLLGRGDVMYKMTTMPNLERAQGALIENDEVIDVVNYLKSNNKPYYDEFALDIILRNSQLYAPDGGGDSQSRPIKDNGEQEAVDETYLRVLRMAIVTKTVSISHVQRRMGLGYPRAAKIVDWMEEQGFISPSLENKQRTVNITKEEYEQLFGEFDENYR